MRLLITLAAACAALAQTPAREIDAALAELTRISGLKPRRAVAYDLISREKVNEFLKRRVAEVSTPEELRAEEVALKKFGLVPPEFNLRETTVDVLTEQAAAFYDYKTHKLFLSDWTASSMRDAVLVHELAHALADQNFNLDRFIRKARKNDDASVARMAVMEGQATWLMSEYLARRMGQSLADSPSLVQMMSRTSEGSGQFPVFDKAPRYIRESLMFPYSQGMLFQNAVFEREGKAAFASVFRNPPVSTQQVLHPEAYFAALRPAEPDPPPLAEKRGYQELIAGSFGELDHLILLQEYAGKETAESLSPHLRGGSYRVWEDRGKTRAILTYASEWDSPETARQFFDAYRAGLARKWKNLEPHERSPTLLSGRGDDGYFLTEVRGAVVSTIEGCEKPVR
ncbi:MAG: hypothetical protein ACE15B_10055 [Bryobacteraceae bacterium]